MRAQHSSASPSWGTPGRVVDLARAVLGRIDLDPFSDEQWNGVVGAARFLSEEGDAFRCAWFEGAPTAAQILDGEVYAFDTRATHHTALVNAPGDARGVLVKHAWLLTEWHHRAGWLGGGALWVAFNIGQFQTLQGVPPRSLLHHDFLRCVPRRRLDYDKAPGVRGGAPPHASALVLLPAHGHDGNHQRRRFTELCAEIGEVF